MTGTLAAEFRKNTREVIRVVLDEYQGHQLAGVRVWAPNDDGEFRPTKAGISIKVGKLIELQDAIGKAIEIARSRGLIE